MTANAVVIENLKFGYHPEHPVIDMPSMAIARGSSVFVHGPSGTGKTTLLGLIAGILTPQSGHIRILGSDIASMSGSQRDLFRGSHIGFIFQMFNLLPYLSVKDNIQVPCKLSTARRERLGGKDINVATYEIAESLGIDRALSLPVTHLSVGQQQRVAVARAMLGAPEIIIADEPTSALDSDRKDQFLQLLFKQAAAINATVLFVSHDLSLRPLFKDVVSLASLNKAVHK